MSKSNRLQLKVAKTNDEFKQIYRLRYDVYVTEMKRKQIYCDNFLKEIKEPIDTYSTLLCCKVGDEIIGSSRITQHDKYPLRLDSYYGISELTNSLNLSVTEGSKLIIKKKYRGTKELIGKKMLFLGYKVLQEFNIDIDFLNANSYLVDFYAKMGYRKILSSFLHPELNQIVYPMALIIKDRNYISTINSPLIDHQINHESIPEDKNQIIKKLLKIN